LVDRQILPVERICGENHVRVDHLIVAAAAPALPPGVVHVCDALAEWKRQHPLFALLAPDDVNDREGAAVTTASAGTRHEGCRYVPPEIVFATFDISPAELVDLSTRSPILIRSIKTDAGALYSWGDALLVTVSMNRLPFSPADPADDFAGAGGNGGDGA
jgi:hypothetical protein